MATRRGGEKKTLSQRALNRATLEREMLLRRWKLPMFMDSPMPCVVLIDGFTNGIWQLIRERRNAILTIQPFKRLSKKDTTALTEEGVRLLRFAAVDDEHQDIRFLAPKS